MTKLAALSKLANAYHYVINAYAPGRGAEHILNDKFNYVRRSLRIADLKPQPKCEEGFNGKGPTYL